MLTPDNLAEAQLQQELREMFLLDTQQQLEVYFDIILQLQAESWTGDIQSIYRAIHTIKGGAVTVDASSMLHAATALEDLLSDLRYLEIAPPLSDGNLGEMLLEAGELLASCLEVSAPDPAASVESQNRVQLTLQRLEHLHIQVKEKYLPDWNEMRQVHQEFADQGFDLVILDLEMELANLPDRGAVPAPIVETAQATIDQLTQIGRELELADGWAPLIHRCDRLAGNPSSQIWRALWLPYFAALKACVKNSGEISPTEVARLDALESAAATAELDRPALAQDLLTVDPNQVDPVASNIATAAIDPVAGDLPDLLDDFFADDLGIEEFGQTAPTVGSAAAIANNFETDEWATDEDLQDLELPDLEIVDQLLAPEIDRVAAENDDLPDLLDNFFADEEVAADSIAMTISDDQTIVQEIIVIDPLDLLAVDQEQAELSALLDDFDFDEASAVNLETDQSVANAIDQEIVELLDLDDFAELAQLDEFEVTALAEHESTEQIEPTAKIAMTELAIEQPSSSTIATTPAEVKRGVSIPVPLERLDRSAQQVVDTLLTARAVRNVSSRLQAQLSQLSVLTQESSQFVTRLRQLQDDYALLHSLNDDRESTTSNGVTTERYRQGYGTIVRLLENILRMSELGQEIETATYQNHNHLDDLDRSIMRLKDGIETSRLVPFKNLTLRAKAILRDLTNRYDKPAELIVQNEHVELDAGIIQQLEPALLHLLRNAYDHGLETPAQRSAAGKPERGIIAVSLHRQGNLYRLEVEDDGGGIDAQVIYQIAKSKGFAMNVVKPDQLTNSELLQILCQPGFSSSNSINEVSGRGVGMDVVVAQMASIGGRLSLETWIGHGTKFTIEVPAPQLLVPCVLFQVGERTVAFPTEEVLETTLLSSISAKMSADDEVGMCAWTLTTNRGEVAGFDLANYWQFAQRSLTDTAVCIRTRQGSGQEIWSIADDLLGQAELLINPLPSPLVAPVGLLGVSLQADGRLISVLDPVALVAKLSAGSNASDYSFNTLAAEQTKPSAPTILIVDDAALMRRRLEASLTAGGFITHTCNDGLEALNWLQTNPLPDLVITDVEMPNMDGFTLIDRARQLQIEIPILVISSRLAAEWGKEARRLGANDYLNKGFSTPELLNAVNGLLGLVVV
jgi:chemotaxis protein histidine kinase CheA/CheY-like chemotaxis protein